MSVSCRIVIDRRRARAVWRQVADDLRAKIDSGEYPPGGDLLSADAICRTYGVGAEVASRVLHDLAGRGLIVTEAGRVARVREPEPQRDLWLRKATWSTRFPTAEEQDEFGIGEYVPVAVVEYRDRVEVYPCDRYVFHTD